MAFGPVMQLKTGELEVELAPLSKEVMGEYVAPGLQHASITKYLFGTQAPVLEDEYDWFDKARGESDSLVWGVYVRGAEDRLLIGSSALTHITKDRFVQSVSGSLIFRKEYWGRGIASAIHKARTWYAFQHLGHDRVASVVIQGNVGSRRALEKAGYTFTHLERNAAFVDGSLRHQDHLECLNPSDAAWNRWWGNDAPSPEALEARLRTHEAMQWAEKNVMLP